MFDQDWWHISTSNLYWYVSQVVVGGGGISEKMLKCQDDDIGPVARNLTLASLMAI